MPRRAGLGQEEVRRNNLSNVLSVVHVSGPTTRAQLTDELGLNRSTIGDLTGRLVEFGLVEERPTGPGPRVRAALAGGGGASGRRGARHRPRAWTGSTSPWWRSAARCWTGGAGCTSAASTT